MTDFTQYVHEFTDDRGRTRYAVGRWAQHLARYIVPHDKTTHRLTGCFASYARKPAGLPDRYADRRRALRRARYLYRPDTP